MINTDSNSGPYYRYAHLPLKYRDKISMVLEKLRTLGVDNGRILDLHYPTRGVVYLLIHKDYLDVLTSTLTKHDLTLLDNFDPLDPTNLKDPAFATTISEKKEKLLGLHQKRLTHVIQFVRPYLRGIVARGFVQQDWLTSDQIKYALNPNNSVTH